MNAAVSVPDGLASATLAGVNPVYGLYASIAAPIAGSALVSAQLMQISTTTASAFAAGQVIAGYSMAERADVRLACRDGGVSRARADHTARRDDQESEDAAGADLHDVTA